MAKCKRCVEGVPHEFNHGRSGYSHHGCRCAMCVKAEREYMSKYWRSEKYRESRREYRSSEKYRKYRREYRSSEKYRKYQREYNLESAEMTPSRRRIKEANNTAANKGKWTPGEIKLLHNPDLTNIEIAELLSRTYRSVKDKRHEEFNK